MSKLSESKVADVKYDMLSTAILIFYWVFRFEEGILEPTSGAYITHFGKSKPIQPIINADRSFLGHKAYLQCLLGRE